MLISCTDKDIVKEYLSTGELIKEYQVENGLKNGFYREYHKNGNLRFEGVYINGKPSKDSKFYYENGDLLCETFLDSCYKYQEDGSIMKGIVKENRMVGWWKLFYPNNSNEYYLKEFIKTPESDTYENQNIFFLKRKRIDSLSVFYSFKKLNKNKIRIDYNSQYLTEKRTILKLIYNNKLEKDFSNQNQIILDTVYPLTKNGSQFEVDLKSNDFFRGFIVEESYLVQPTNKDKELYDISKYNLKTYVDINF